MPALIDTESALTRLALIWGQRDRRIWSTQEVLSEVLRTALKEAETARWLDDDIYAQTHRLLILDDTWIDPIATYAEGQPFITSTAEVATSALRMGALRVSRADRIRIGNILRTLGLVPRTIWDETAGASIRVWAPTSGVNVTKTLAAYMVASWAGGTVLAGTPAGARVSAAFRVAGQVWAGRIGLRAAISRLRTGLGKSRAALGATYQPPASETVIRPGRRMRSQEELQRLVAERVQYSPPSRQYIIHFQPFAKKPASYNYSAAILRQAAETGRRVETEEGLKNWLLRFERAQLAWLKEIDLEHPALAGQREELVALQRESERTIDQLRAS